MNFVELVFSKRISLFNMGEVEEELTSHSMSSLTLDPQPIQPPGTPTTDSKAEPTSDPAHEHALTTKPEPKYMSYTIFVPEPELIAESDQV